jgi:hypothetical protein
MKQSAVIFLVLAPCTPAPPGKSTIAASDAMVNLAWTMKYLPLTIAEDNGVGNEGPASEGEFYQGRLQALQNNSYTAPNCQLYSAKGTSSSGSSYVSMTSNGMGNACTYSSGKKYGSSGAMYKVYAFNQVQCCNACVGTDGCAAATFETSSKDHSGGKGPQSWEGFGIHLPQVTASKTTGGITVDELVQKYTSRFGDFSKFDAFMDYSVTFFVFDLQHYLDTFNADNIKHFLGQWLDDKNVRWYSMIFQVPASTYVIELVSTMQPSVNVVLPEMEQRMSDVHCDKFRSYQDHPAKVLLISSINRAASDMKSIDDFHTGLLKAKTTQTIDAVNGVTRKCYTYMTDSDIGMPPGGQALDEDVCFTSRISDAQQDAIFSVKDSEEMLWAAHAGTLGSDPRVMTDQYTDSHYALPLPSAGLTALSSYFASNNPYPITKDTRLAYACMQNYIIDPTGFCIQPLGQASWPNCGRDVIV